MALNHEVNGSPVEVKHINYGTAGGYTKIGSPTISNGVVINPTDKQNTIVTTETLNVGDNPWEMQFKLLNPTRGNSFLFRINGSNQTRATTSNSNGIQLFPNYPADSTAAVRFPSLASAWGDAIGNSASVFYWKLVCSGKNAENKYPVRCYCSLDGQNWTADTDNQEYAVALASGTWQVSSYQSFSVGQQAKYDLDLNETYIKVNGKLWFYRPATNYVVKDGKLIWADSGLYIEENGVKTYATQNLAPVPSGYTYGSTTTTDVGIVDMTTQVFTAHPGATLGKDE